MYFQLSIFNIIAIILNINDVEFSNSNSMT